MSLVFDRLTDDDLLFPDVKLPHKALLPSFGPIGPLFPFGSPSPH